MSKLSATKIIEERDKGNLNIIPFSKRLLNPNSYNVKLSNVLKVYKDDIILDCKKDNSYTTITIPETGLILKPGKLYIGSTVERVSSDKYVTGIDGRSSLGRLGISVHATAGFGDIGFDGTYTLEIFCVQPVVIYPNIEIAQVYFEDILGDVDFLYNGRYQGQTQPETSKLFMKEEDLKDDYHYRDKR